MRVVASWERNLSPSSATVLPGKNVVGTLNADPTAAISNFEEKPDRRRRSKRRKPMNDTPNTRFRDIKVVSPAFEALDKNRYVKGCRDHMKLMTDMPFDVLFEILGYLEPVDLLHLSWVNRSLNGLIMGKAGKHLWDQTFAKLKLSGNYPPSCPNDLNPAQYTRFLWGTSCMLCESAKSIYDSWTLRLRVCQDCLLDSGSFMASRLMGEDQDWELSCIIGAHGHAFILKSEYNEHITKMSSLIDQEDQLELARQEWNKAFRRKSEGVIEYGTWQSKRKIQHRNDDFQFGSPEREIDILKRLQGLGWEESDIQTITNGKLSDLPGFSEFGPLTDQEWNTLQETLLLHLQQLKNASMEGKQREILFRRLGSLREKINKFESTVPAILLPTVEDIACQEPYQSRLLDGNDEVINTAVDEEELAQIIANWNEMRRRYLLSLIPSYLAVASNSDPLELAFTYFSFDGPRPDISFPYTQAYSYRVEGLGKIPDDAPRALHLLRGHFTRPWSWDSHAFFFNHRTHQIAKSIIIATGRDPFKVTSQAMDQLSERLSFRCLRCSEFNIVGGWREAVEHEANCHFDALELPIHFKWDIHPNV
ncbi:hypothetical protein AN958_00773 [Leucoagaricus sp. SymC.cos]|nr:hypothetical protein AN958_00773 [Leucoagaricus sp. SymC.cos]